MKKDVSKYVAVILTLSLLFPLALAVPVANVSADATTNLALTATPSASSQLAAGYGWINLNDNVINGYGSTGGSANDEWVSNSEKAGAWAQLTWSSSQVINEIKLYDRPNSTEHILTGTLSFSDGTTIDVGALPNTGNTALVVDFVSKTVTWVKFTVNTCTGSAIGLAEFQVYNTGVAPPTPSPSPANYTNLALTATGSASTEYGPAYGAINLNDNVIGGYSNGNSEDEWISNAEKVGAWAMLTWATAQTIDRVKLYDRPNASDQILSGTLTFSDGTSVTVGELPNTDNVATVVNFTAKTVTWVKFTVDSVSASTTTVGLAEFQAYYTGEQLPSSSPTPTPSLSPSPSPSPTPSPTPSPSPDPNMALSATTSASSELAAGYGAINLNDNVINGYGGPGGSSYDEWISNMETTGAWAQLNWGTAKTMNQIKLYDRPNPNEQILSGTLTFSDGSSVSVGALPNTNNVAEVVNFASKTVTWVRFTVDSVKDGTAAVGLAEFQVYYSNQPALSIASGIVTVINAPATCVLIIASYNGTKLIDAKAISNVTDAYTIANEISTAGATSCKAFLWNNTNDIKPLCEAAIN